MLKDLVEEIKALNHMIDVHTQDEKNEFMRSQYKTKRDRLMCQLEEIIDSIDES
jgi:ribosomal protein S15P/S13E